MWQLTINHMEGDQRAHCKTRLGRKRTGGPSCVRAGVEPFGFGRGAAGLAACRGAAVPPRGWKGRVF